jgi:hypothetical protein
MAREDVVHVLRHFREALVPDGVMLDLQVIRPHPVIEVEGAVVCEIDGGPLFETADAAAAAVDAMVGAGLLVEEAIDDHYVLKHYPTGTSLVEDFAPKKRELPAEAVPLLESVAGECVVRERCRLRRLRAASPGS